jgi:DNA-binding MarR family transcriptional regulator
MLTLSWEMTVLSRAMSYSNLSAAAQHVGLSQPQLSRIVSKLEAETGLMLLDRRSKRNSTWTPKARELVLAYQRADRTFKSDLQRISEDSVVESLRIGTLEGLRRIALKLIEKLLEKAFLKTIEVDVYDIGPLEERFMRGVLDLALTVQEPSRSKVKYLSRIGYQSVDFIEGRKDLKVFSPYEYGIMQIKNPKSLTSSKILISNSLLIREDFMTELKASGSRPSDVTPTRSSSKPLPVLLLGNEILPKKVWDEILTHLRLG